MKNLFLILISFTIFACNNIPDYSKMKKTELSTAQTDSIKAGIENDISQLTFDEKLEICLVKYSNDYPDKYNNMLEDKPESVRSVLIEDKDFLRICESYSLDPSLIRDEYFNR